LLGGASPQKGSYVGSEELSDGTPTVIPTESIIHLREELSRLAESHDITGSNVPTGCRRRQRFVLISDQPTEACFDPGMRIRMPPGQRRFAVQIGSYQLLGHDDDFVGGFRVREAKIRRDLRGPQRSGDAAGAAPGGRRRTVFGWTSARGHQAAASGPRHLERLAWLMDRSISIPGIKLRVGLDAILGLFPVAGDLVCGLVQTGLVLVALHHYKVPKAVATRMAANVLIDTTFGSIPVVGDFFDALFKSNTRNVALLAEAREHQRRGEPMPSAPSVGYLAGIAAVLLLTLGLVAVGLATVIYWLVKAVSH